MYSCANKKETRANSLLLSNVMLDPRMTLRYREDPLLSFPFLDMVGCQYGQVYAASNSDLD